MAIQAAPATSTPYDAPEKTQHGAFAIVTVLFFMWGFITALNDILIPHLKPVFDLTYPEIMLIQFAFFSAYFVFAVPSGWLVERFGYRNTMVLALVIMAAGAMLFIPAASLPSFPFFLVALIVLAGGMTALQTSANPYVGILGPPQGAASRLNLTQAFNSLGTTIAPWLGGLLILNVASKKVEELRTLAPAALQAYRLEEAARLKLPYFCIGMVLLLLALTIRFWKLPGVAVTQDFRAGDLAPQGSIWQRTHLILGVVAIFLYVGAEVSIGSFLINYLSQSYVMGFTEQHAAKYVSLYWGSAMIGRFAGALLMRYIRSNMVLAWAAIIALLLVATSMMSNGHAAMWAILLVGLFNSIMFPTIFTLATAGLGPLTGRGSGLLVAGIVGGALVPLAQGALAEHIGLHHAFILPVFCYLYIAYYGLRGSIPGKLKLA